MPCTEAAGLSDADLDALADLAVLTLRAALLDTAPAAQPELAHLGRPGASFVTLKQQGRLRGCVGSLAPHRALREDVVANALAAAFRDPRFTPLAAHELDATELAVSVLTPATALAFASEDELYAALRPGVDGLIIEHAGRRATYLPAVWELLPEPRHFIAELRRKAAIAPDLALTALSVSRYSTRQSRVVRLAPG
jgi:AmmeMemoRadiSam system protein A